MNGPITELKEGSHPNNGPFRCPSLKKVLCCWTTGKTCFLLVVLYTCNRSNMAQHILHPQGVVGAQGLLRLQCILTMQWVIPMQCIKPAQHNLHLRVERAQCIFLLVMHYTRTAHLACAQCILCVQIVLGLQRVLHFMRTLLSSARLVQ